MSLKKKIILIGIWILELVFGFCLGMLFHYFILEKFHFPTEIDRILLMILCVSLAIGYVISVHIRCISILIIPYLLGKSGRHILKAFLLSCIIAGPVHNLLHNGGKIFHVFVCSAHLQCNITKTRLELMYQPYAQAIFNIKPKNPDIKDTFRGIEDMVRPIRDEIDKPDKNVEPNDKVEEKYKPTPDELPAAKHNRNFEKKLELRCEDMISRAKKECVKIFSKTYDECLAASIWATGWTYCWPMKLEFICNIAKELKVFGSCNRKNMIGKTLGSSYERLLEIQKSYKNDSDNVKVVYKLKGATDNAFLHNVQEGVAMIKDELGGKISILASILKAIDILIALLCVRLMFVSQKYNENYLIKIDHDNIYITKYFRKVDSRRRNAGKLFVLPLDSLDKMETKYINEYSFLCGPGNCMTVVQQLMILVVEIITATIFILLDNLFYDALDIVRKHADMTIQQQGSHNISLQIKGTGFVAKIVRSMLKTFNVSKEVKVTRSTTECLPQPTMMDQMWLYKLYLGYGLLIILVLIDFYISRLRRKICSIFHRRREKQRILFIYNNALRVRKHLVKRIRNIIHELASEAMLTTKPGELLFAPTKRSKYLAWLKIFELKSCKLCGKKESCLKILASKLLKKIIYVCPACNFTYCTECWTKLGMICYACEFAFGSKEILDPENMINNYKT